ncbi:hypothetical protein [Clostridium lundense]|uniref:hypothetical protein n=1 Tax=Clostridium lundense TaxID=319475 RepID=UPI00048675C3|nr:hypothetical protein [Clostridium lundense]
MDDNSVVKVRIKKIQDINNEDLLRYELYSILATIILSKEEFKNNKEISVFLKSFNISFKEYVMKNRTIIMANTLRKIEKADLDTLQMYKKVLKDLYLLNTKEFEVMPKDKKQAKENYMNGILNKYSRNKG